nr:trypsin-like peptidase domain-containing protein [Pyrinomonadaceae bacterium]
MTLVEKATTANLSAATTPLLAGELTKIAEGVRRSAVEVRGHRSGGGSGVIWRADGLVVTNAHVIRGRETEVVLADGRTFAAAVVKRDDVSDLAALILEGRAGTEARDLPTATIGDSDNLRVGEVVLA